jgi:tRNA-modifying protein YgfZ
LFIVYLHEFWQLFKDIMGMSYFTRQNNRRLIRVSGEDRCKFLQGLVTNDVTKVDETNSIYTALLSPQGRYLFDFFIFQDSDSLVLDVAGDRANDLADLLRKYKLRSTVEIDDTLTDVEVLCIPGPIDQRLFNLKSRAGMTTRADGYVAYIDPRETGLGIRHYGPASWLVEQGYEPVNYEKYDVLRLLFGLPNGAQDMPINKAIPLECRLDEINAIAWDKGCYLGQELTARTKHQGLVRKQLMPVEIIGDPVPPMTPILFNGEEIGTMRSSCHDRGLAMIRFEAIEQLGNDGVFMANNSEIVPDGPIDISYPE